MTDGPDFLSFLDWESDDPDSLTVGVGKSNIRWHMKRVRLSRAATPWSRRYYTPPTALSP